jgi:hypothetical protein
VQTGGTIPPKRSGSGDTAKSFLVESAWRSNDRRR